MSTLLIRYFFEVLLVIIDFVSLASFNFCNVFLALDFSWSFCRFSENKNVYVLVWQIYPVNPFSIQSQLGFIEFFDPLSSLLFSFLIQIFHLVCKDEIDIFLLCAPLSKWRNKFELLFDCMYQQCFISLRFLCLL